MTTPYYQDDAVTLYHGDALAVLLDIKHAGCMILDPPYHMAPSTFRGKDDGAASSIATPVRLLTETFRHPIYVASKGTPSIRDKGAIPNVVNADHPTDKEHPYEKPARVWEHLLSRIPETTVLDAFAGSCTSADAAIRNGHKWIGIEADERHCEAAARRWGQDALDFGGAA